MRNAPLIPLFLAAGLTVLAAQSFLSQPQESPIYVRVRGTHVHFRSSRPETPDAQNIIGYADPGKTFIAYDKKPGMTAEYFGEWFYLKNVATGETGWVAKPYVEAINPQDEPRLQQLGTILPTSTSPLLPRLDNILGIIAAMLSILTSRWLILKLRKRAPREYQPKVPANVNTRPSPLSTGPNSSGRPPIIYGTNGGTPWIYRPKTSSQ